MQSLEGKESYIRGMGECEQGFRQRQPLRIFGTYSGYEDLSCDHDRMKEEEQSSVYVCINTRRKSVIHNRGSC